MGDGGSGMIEFYNRQTDPTEMINLAHNPECDRLIKYLDAQLNERIRESSKPTEGLKVIKIVFIYSADSYR